MWGGIVTLLFRFDSLLVESLEVAIGSEAVELIALPCSSACESIFGVRDTEIFTGFRFSLPETGMKRRSPSF